MQLPFHTSLLLTLSTGLCLPLFADVPTPAPPTALAAALPQRKFPTRDTITGAQINEAKIRKTIRVTPATLQSGFGQAYASLLQGVPTKIVLAPGIYRSMVSGLDWNREPAKNTLLVIEGDQSGGTTWEGADAFPAEQWTLAAPGLWAANWKYDFGNYSPSWGTPKLEGHRYEMAWVDNKPLKPVILEHYDLSKRTDWNGAAVYQHFTPPQQTLTPGTFGVAERNENGNKIYVCLPDGKTPQNSRIEITVRQKLLDLFGKNNVVVRNITFQHIANTQKSKKEDLDGALVFARGGAPASQNVLLDHVSVLWSGGSGLSMAGQNWTIRNSEFSYNGLSGIGADGCENFVFDGVTTNFIIPPSKVGCVAEIVNGRQ